MTKSYEEYENEQLGKAKTQSDAFAAERKAQADSAAAASDGRYDAAIRAAEKNYADSATTAEKAYRAVYDANVVNELVARRRAAEAIANANQANSGLNNTQQTAISLQRGRADAETTRRKQATVDAIMRELDAVREQYNADKIAASQSIYAQADADILNFKNNADAAARQNAASMYTADQEAYAKQYAADQEFLSKQAQNFSEEKLAMRELGYAYDETVKDYVFVGTEEQRLAAADQHQRLAKQGYIYDEKQQKYVNLGSESAANRYYHEQYLKYLSRNEDTEKVLEYIELLKKDGLIEATTFENWKERYVDAGVAWFRKHYNLLNDPESLPKSTSGFNSKEHLAQIINNEMDEHKLDEDDVAYLIRLYDLKPYHFVNEVKLDDCKKILCNMPVKEATALIDQWLENEEINDHHRTVLLESLKDSSEK